MEGPAAYVTGPGPQSSTCHLLPGLLGGFSSPMYTEGAEDSRGCIYYRAQKDAEGGPHMRVWLSYIVPLVTSHVFPSGRGQGRNLQRGAEWG